MTGSRHHAADDGSLARSTGGAAARGAMLIALAVVIGLVLLAFVLDDPATVVTAPDGTEQEAGADDSEAEAEDAGEGTVNVQEPEGTEGSEDAVIPEDDVTNIEDEVVPADPGDTRVPAEVNVLSANGTGGSGVAGAISDKVKARGYIGEASNATVTQDSVIYYREGYSADAIAIAGIVGATPEIVLPAPADIPVAQNAIDDGRLAAAHVVVIIGNDGRIPVG